MSQFTSKDGTSLLSQSWPSMLPQYAKGEYDLATLHAAGRLVPTHEDALRAWCFVAINAEVTDKSNNRFLAYTSTESESEVQEVAVRFQGFVRRAALGPYGTWDGKRETAIKAVQALTLVGGPARSNFNAQVQASRILRQYVVEELKGQYATNSQGTNQLEFTHRLFYKVRPTDSDTYAPPHDPSNSLSSHAKKISHEWQAHPGVRIGVQEQNSVRSAPGREIRAGDFVDVTATVNIVQRRSFNNTHTYVSFKPVRVVRLATASMVKSIPDAKDAPQEDGDGSRQERMQTMGQLRKVVLADVEL